MRWALLTVALVLLNLSLTFVSIWPTLGVRASAQLSLEAALLVLGLAVVRAWRGQPVSARTRGLLAAIWVLLVIGRYIDVSTRSLYGRSVNLYWDLKLLPDVGAMFAFVAHPAMLAAVVAGVVLVPVLIYLPVRWAIGRVTQRLQSPPRAPRPDRDGPAAPDDRRRPSRGREPASRSSSSRRPSRWRSPES